MKDVEYLAKDDFVSTGGNKGYKAISEEKVTNTVRTSLIKNNLVILPVKREFDRVDEPTVDKYGNPKVNRLTTVKSQYKIVNIDNPDEFELIESGGTGVDTQDKGIGKAMTYDYKYLLLRTFAIPTGEDPDKVSSDVYTEQLHGSNDKTNMNEAKVTTEMLEHAIKNAGFTTEKVIARYEKDSGKKVSELKFISQEYKKKYYDGFTKKQ